MKNISFSETHYYKLKFHIDIEVLRKCSPSYDGNSFEEFKLMFGLIFFMV